MSFQHIASELLYFIKSESLGFLCPECQVLIGCGLPASHSCALLCVPLQLPWNQTFKGAPSSWHLGRCRKCAKLEHRIPKISLVSDSGNNYFNAICNLKGVCCFFGQHGRTKICTWRCAPSKFRPLKESHLFDEPCYHSEHLVLPSEPACVSWIS